MSITKGKWEAVENDHFIDIKVDGNPIAQVIVNQCADVDKEQMRANARMMALAPEMLDKLVEVNETISFLIGIYNKRTKDPANFLDAEICSEIQMFIAKVKGDL